MKILSAQNSNGYIASEDEPDFTESGEHKNNRVS